MHKIKPEIKEFILAQKKENPKLSCRKITPIILDKFQVKVSKSSINSIFKTSGLSMPVGRTAKPRRQIRQAQIPGLGIILLKAIDCLVGGTQQIAEAIQSRLNSKALEITLKTEYLFYHLLKPNFDPAPILGQKINPQEIPAYINELEQIPELSIDIPRIISRIFQEVRSIKVTLANKTDFYLDGQMHTIWSTPHIPYNFANTLQNTQKNIFKYFQENAALILFMAPGSDLPESDLFNFITSFEGTGSKVSNLTLYGNSFNELGNVQTGVPAKRFFIMGLLPWQFERYRKIKMLGDLDAEIELSLPSLDKKITLRSCILKKDLSDKPRLIILTNLPPDFKAAEIIQMYLGRWPNLEEAFSDFKRKLELFSYMADSQHPFLAEEILWEKDSSSSVKGLFAHYLKLLEAYFQWHFSTESAQFYELSGRLKRERDTLQIALNLPPDYPLFKDLEYTLRRLNERDVTFPDGKRLEFSL